MNSKQFIILDRDGVINHDSLNYIKTPEEFIPIPESLEAIAKLTAAGYSIGVATNQSGVGRNLYTEATLKAIHEKLMRSVVAQGGRIDALEYCIHRPEENCPCRKPKPGMLIALAKRLGCRLNEIAFVGDRVSDVQAALAVGATPIMILSSMTDRNQLKNYPEVAVYPSLIDYVTQILHD
jgi:D-glycero-D-manno-heptose 1,7-bisphosphate phosphatase